MRIVCIYCGRVFRISKEPFHFVCSCKKILVNMGKFLDCIILDSKKVPVKNLVKKIKTGNINSMNFHEKTNFFDNKYQKKQ